MKNYLIISIIPVLLFLLSGCGQKNADQTANDLVSGISADNGNIVEITSEGFNPRTLTIRSGETVTWVNKGTLSPWPASAVHPSHNAYPESGGCIGSKFDACRGLKQGESYPFTFNQKGTWKYHDHLNSGSIGTIIVQ